MRILLTGCSGLLGRHVYTMLQQQGHEIISLVRKPALCKQEKVVNFDSQKLAIELFKLSPCQAIIHLASHSNLSETARTQDFFGTTLNATMTFINLAKHWQAHLIFSSSISIYAIAPHITLLSPLQPKTAYAITKLLAENLINAANLEISTILRYGGILGLGSQFYLGINKSLIAARDQQLSPIVCGQGRGRRNYIYVKDAAQAILKALQEKITGTHLIAGSEILTIREMAEKICQIFLPDKQPKYESTCFDTPDFLIDNSPLFNTQFDFEKALYDMQGHS
jgi:nucleoside-diphosphate-sugar epimerase